jgi:hypothetical protein
MQFTGPTIQFEINQIMTTKLISPKVDATLASHATIILVNMDRSWHNQFGASYAIDCNDDQGIVNVLKTATAETLWISPGPIITDTLLHTFSRLPAIPQDTNRRLGNLLMLESPRPKTVPLLRSFFGNLAGEAPQTKMLPKDQIREVLSGNKDLSKDLFIAGLADVEFGFLTLIRGDFDSMTVPLSIFRPSDKTKPDFRRLALDDYGHTIRFGAYEASAHHVLYAADAAYRKRINAKRREEEKGFGPSLRRLRILKGFTQGEFHGIALKTIARIERGEVDKPQGRTLAAIAKTLGVNSEEIESY